jgi:hypothetical protein
MLIAIGLMVGAYTFTKLLYLVTRDDTKGIVTTFAVISMILIALCVLGLLATSTPGV